MEGLIVTNFLLWASITVVAFCGIFALFTGYKTLGVLAFVVFLVFGAATLYSATHTLIPINQTGLILNTNTQTIDGDLRPSGIVGKPLFGTETINFPYIVAYRPCEDEHTAASDSTAIKMTICYLSNATSINWKDLFVRYGKKNDGEIFQSWHQLRTNVVDQVMGKKSVTDLTSKKNEIADAILQGVQRIFKEEGYPLTGVVISFWDYENPEAGKQLDTQLAAAKADKEKAKVEQEAAMTRVQTANQVMKEQAKGLNETLDMLGVTDSGSRAQVFQLRMLIDVINQHPNTTVIIAPANVDASAIASAPKPQATQPPAADKK